MMGLNERSLKYFVFDSGWDNIQIPNYPFFIFNTCSENCGLRLGNCGAFSSVFFLPISPQAVINRDPFVSSGLSSRFHLIQIGHAIACT